MNAHLYLDNEQYLFISELDEDHNVHISEDLHDRYNLALLEWEAVQDELTEIYKGKK